MPLFLGAMINPYNVHLYFAALCSPGEELIYKSSSTKVCQPCAIGRYNDRSGTNPNKCKDCKLGFTTVTTGKANCTVVG